LWVSGRVFSEAVWDGEKREERSRESRRADRELEDREQQREKM
jgi:hypothetical protein